MKKYRSLGINPLGDRFYSNDDHTMESKAKSAIEYMLQTMILKKELYFFMMILFGVQARVVFS